MPQQDSDGQISAVRAFNRFYTRKLGVLDQQLLKSPFSLRALTLRPTADTLLGDYVGVPVRSPDPAKIGALARRLHALGFDWDFAPVADVHSEPDNPVIVNGRRVLIRGGGRVVGDRPAEGGQRSPRRLPLPHPARRPRHWLQCLSVPCKTSPWLMPWPTWSDV